MKKKKDWVIQLSNNKYSILHTSYVLVQEVWSQFVTFKKLALGLGDPNLWQLLNMNIIYLFISNILFVCLLLLLIMFLNFFVKDFLLKFIYVWTWKWWLFLNSFAIKKIKFLLKFILTKCELTYIVSFL